MLGEGELRNLLSEAQARVQRGLRVAFVIDGSGEIRARGERSYRFNYVPPNAGDISAARDGVVLIRDWPLNEFRALVPLGEYFDRFLYVSRAVDGEILALLDDTRETVAFYQQLEQDRGRILFQFGALYLGFALILILAAIWMGLNFAERLARPVGRLVEAAEQVGAGDLDVQVRVMRDDDEVALLGRGVQPDDPPAEGAARTPAGKQPPDRCAAAAVRFGAGFCDCGCDRSGCRGTACLH